MKKNLVTAAATAGLVLTAFGASASAQEITYTVHPGDSLWKISHINNVSINNLKEWNQLSSDRIYINQKLSLTYTVKSGDSLGELARSNGTTVRELKNLNGLTSDLIRVGQQLKILNSKSSAQASVSSTPTNTTYVVQKGDSLSEIGARLNLSVSQLKSINHLTTDTIIVGQTLNVRGAQSTGVSAGSAPAPEKPIGHADAGVAEQHAATANSSETQQSAANSESTIVEHQASPSKSSDAEQTVVPNDQTETNTAVANSNSTTAEQPATPSVSAEKPAVTNDSTTAEKPAAPSVSTEKPAVTNDSTTTEKPAAPSVSNDKPAATNDSTTTGKPAAPANSTTATKLEVNSDSNVTQQAAATSASTIQAVIDEAKKYIGSPYRWAGNTPAGFDCSGFTKYVFNNVGISLPRTAETQWAATTPVNSPSIGDLVFFETYKVGPSHVGIYLGNNKFISAAAQGVVISDMTSTYWKTRYLGAKSPY